MQSRSFYMLGINDPLIPYYINDCTLAFFLDLFLDASRDFNYIDREILLKKLEHKGSIRGLALK